MVPRRTGEGLRALRDTFQPGAIVADLGCNLAPDKTPGQIAQFRHRLVMSAPLVGQIHLPHRPQVPQQLDALAGRAAAQLQAFLQIIESQRQRGDEEQAIDLADRSALAECVGVLGEKLNDFNFRRIQKGRPRRAVVHGILLHDTRGCQILGFVQHKMKEIFDCSLHPSVGQRLGTIDWVRRIFMEPATRNRRRRFFQIRRRCLRGWLSKRRPH